MFGFQVDENIRLKILELRDAKSLFRMINQNRRYLAEFLPFVDFTHQIEDSKKFIQAALQQFIDGNGFPYHH